MAAENNFVFPENVPNILMNFSELCRFCLSKTQNDISIRDKCFPEELLETEQDTIYNFVTKLKIIKITSLENFPSLVCKNCYEVIKICYNFIKVCQKSEDLLNNYYEKCIKENLNFLNAVTDFSDKNLKGIHAETINQTGKKLKEISKAQEIKIEKKVVSNSDAVKEFSENFKSSDFTNSIKIASENENCCSSLCSVKFRKPDALNLNYICKHEKRYKELFIKEENTITYYKTTDKKQVLEQPKDVNKVKNFVPIDVKTLYCFYCTPFKEYQSMEDLLQHMKSHEIRDCYNCPYCKDAFSSKLSLNQHLICMHNPPADDLLENVKFLKQKHTNTSMRGDKLIHSVSDLLNFYQDKNKNFKVCCTNCNPSISFCTTSDFIGHMKTHYSNGKLMENLATKVKTEVKNNSRLKCSYCPAIYSQKQYLIHHMRQKHNKQNPTSLKCPVCSETFLTNRKVIQHGIIAHEKYFATFHNIFNKIIQSSHEEVIQNKNFECDMCQKRYIFKASLKKHIFSVHLGEPKGSIICPYCGKTLANKFNLKSHIEFKHQAIFVSCPICKKKINFRTIGRHYKVHRNALEIGLMNSFLCTQCGKILKSKRSFEDHQKLHKNVRNELCDICGGGYATKKALRLHKKTHEGMEKKIYECDQCDKVFSGGHTLKRHLLTHSGVKNFICEICSKCFYTLQELKRHVRYHKKEYRFECQQCDMRFVDKSRFRHHLMKHKNIRPYKCRFCEKMFIVRGKMNLHMASKHNFHVDSRRVWKDPKAYVPLDKLL